MTRQIRLAHGFRFWTTKTRLAAKLSFRPIFVSDGAGH